MTIQLSINQKPDYRGALVYRQEDGYTMVTLTISVLPSEHSQVISHACDLPVPEEAEHLPGIDLYHFAGTFDTRIQVTIATPMGAEEAWYIASRQTVLALVSLLHLSIVPSSESISRTPTTRSSKSDRQSTELVESDSYQGRR